MFRIGPSGSFTNLYSFSGPDGENPQAALVQGSDGNFYGTSSEGGTNGAGTVVKLSVSLCPSANQISQIQLLGTNVVITIPAVAGETYQLQCRDDLAADAWSNVAGASIAKAIGGMVTSTNIGGALPSQRVYRFDITP